MMRVMSRTGIMVPVLSGSLLALVGCGGTTEESPTPTAVPPTPTATPVPPTNDYFRVTSMAVGGSDEGVDLNNDNEIDNGIEDALTEISTGIMSAIEDALAAASIPEAQQALILSAVEEILATTFSVDTMSQAINAPIEAGDINYIMQFLESGSKTGIFDLNWSAAEFQSKGFKIVDELGTQAGTIDGSGDGLFGPGDLTLTLSQTAPNGTETSTDLVLAEGITMVSGYDGSAIDDGVAGGAIEVAFLLDLVETTLNDIIVALEDIPTPPGSGGGSVEIPEIDVDAILTTLDEALTDQADIELTDGGAAFSIGLLLTAEEAIIVE